MEEGLLNEQKGDGKSLAFCLPYTYTRVGGKLQRDPVAGVDSRGEISAAKESGSEYQGRTVHKHIVCKGEGEE